MITIKLGTIWAVNLHSPHPHLIILTIGAAMNPNIKFNSPSLTEDSLNQPPQSRPHKNLDPLFHPGIQKPTWCLGSGSKRHAGNGGITANYVVICKMAMIMHCIAKGSSENMHIFKFPNGAKQYPGWQHSEFARRKTRTAHFGKHLVNLNCIASQILKT